MTATATELVRSLAELSAADLDLAGGKGANLGELTRAGFPVPDGFVVTTAAYDAFVAANDLAGRIAQLSAGDDAEDEIGALFEHAAMPSAVVDAIADAYAALGEGQVAVRSSATAEDLPEASFAGQLDTLLNVDGAGAVLHAVRHCWASLWNTRAIAYRSHRHAAAARLSVAVVVQRLVDADVAGVMFTANPHNGRRDQCLVTAAWGLGEAVVGGLVDTDSYVVDAGGAVTATIADKAVMTVTTDDGSAEAPTPEDRRHAPALTDAQAGELAALGRRVAARFAARAGSETPQDIEWAIADGTIHLLQARPITALPAPSGDVPTTWPLPRPKSLYFRASIVEQLPDPLTPLFAGLIATAVPDGLRGLLDELRPGGKALDIAFPTINGYAFYDYSHAAMNQMWSLTTPGLKLLLTDGFVLKRWRDRELPRYRATVAEWSARNPAELTAAELLDATQRLLDAGCLYYTTVQTIIPVASFAELTWTGLYDRALKRSGGPAAAEFLLGFDSAPIEAEKSLHTIALWCLSHPELVPVVRAATPATALGPTPAGIDPCIWTEWRNRLREHLDTFGHTVYNLDFSQPVPADDPAPVLDALRHQLSGKAADPEARQRRLAERRGTVTRELLQRLDPVRRALARKSLKPAQDWAPIREDALAAMGLAWPTMRRFLHELGRRLVAAGALRAADEVFWLTRDEAAALAAAVDAGSATASHADAVDERRMTWRGQLQATPPQYLPVNAAMNLMENFLPARNEVQTGPVIKGTSGSGGQVTGRARVLTGPADFADFQAGEILVAAITTPAFTPLFARAAAVVTDIGGVLSHGSIVAREYGIPAVLGTGVATRRIATGDLITVDGTAGRVLLEDAPAEAPVKHAGRGPAIAAAGAVALSALGIALWRRTH